MTHKEKSIYDTGEKIYTSHMFDKKFGNLNPNMHFIYRLTLLLRPENPLTPVKG